MVNMDISEPGVDVNDIFIKFANDCLQPWDRQLHVWRHIDVWWWSINFSCTLCNGSPTTYSVLCATYYANQLLIETDKKIISYIMEINMDKDIISLVDAWISLGWVSCISYGAFYLTDDGIRMLKENGGDI